MSFRIHRMCCILAGIAFSSVLFAQTSSPAPIAMAPIDGQSRLHWLLVENLGPGGLIENVLIGAAETATNTPKEYGPHWTGFRKRTGMVTANYGVQSLMEAGLGSIWGEDPRYDKTQGLHFGARLGHVVKMTFLARNRDGK